MSSTSTCKVAVFSAKVYDRASLTQQLSLLGHNIEFTFLEPRLTPATVSLAKGFSVVCAFINDVINEEVLKELDKLGIRQVALRCAGFNNVDLVAAEKWKITVCRVPAYSPYAVAEHAVGLMICLNRNLHRAFSRVRDGNFSINGLLGMDFHGKTFGFLGTGRIGFLTARICSGFGCNILGCDPYKNADFEKLGGKYVEMDELLATSDIISLHCPLTPESHHLINEKTIAKMKPGAVIVNTSRGPLIHSRDMIEGLKSGKVGGLAIDVYEDEEEIFFEDLSSEVLQDDTIARLLTFPNVMITAHQAFFTKEALEAIAKVTIGNIASFDGQTSDDSWKQNQVKNQTHRRPSKESIDVKETKMGHARPPSSPCVVLR